MAVNRKEFFKRSAAVGGCCGAALLAGSVLGLPEALQGQAGAGAAAPQRPLTPLDKRVEQGQKVIMRMVAKMDERLDKPTRDGLMAACGAACFQGSRPPQPKPTAEQAAQNFGKLRKWVGPTNVVPGERETLVHFEYTQNHAGLKVADGYCLCPIFENAPKGMSPTYCECSRGYVQQMVGSMLGREVTVELKAALLRGDKGCKFDVHIPVSA